MSNVNLAAKVIFVNTLLILAAACLVPLAAFKFKYGKVSLTNDEIKKIAGGIEVGQAHSDRGFNEAIKSLKQDEIYCNQPHPVIGWIDICASDEFWGFSQVTAKEKSPRSYRVLVVGGSVANYLGKGGALKAALNSRLREIGSRQSLEVFNAAVPGFKQPQQVSVINALIASGWKFDSIINVSGNNEIAFVANHLFLEGYSPLLPYAHPERALMAAKMLYKPQDECKKQNSLSWHPVAQYLKILCYRETLGKMKGFIHFQPYLSAMRYKDDIPVTQNEAIERALDIWLASSRSSYAIASINGIDYLEVIQPSQYLEGSKKFSPEEEKFVRSDKTMKVVGKGYSKVKASSFGLQDANILDARFIFANTVVPVYSDSCCHLNQEGERILAAAIARKLIH